MLHRRTTSTAPSTGPSNPPPTNQNKAYTPLRRPSQTLYNTPSSQSAKARYALPSPSLNYLTPGQSQSSYIQRPSIDLGDDGFGDSLGGGGGGLEGWVKGFKFGLERFRMGMRDGLKLDRSLTLVWGDRELRTLVLKSTLINLLSLLLLSLLPIIISPIIASNPSAQSRTKEIGLWYNLLLSWPVFATCFLINAQWSPHISKRAQTLLHPSYRHQPSPISTPSGLSSNSSQNQGQSPISWLIKAIARLLLIIDFTFVSKILGLIPLFGRILGLGYMSVIDSYYFFDWTFTSRGMSLDRRVDYMQGRLAYMAGFGIPATLITSFGPPLVNMAIFALLYPIFVIQAIQSRPPSPKHSLLPSTPSPSTPASPTMESFNDPFFNSSTPAHDHSYGNWDITKMEFKIPIFFFARYALQGLSWFEAAVLRDRGGAGVRRWQERAGKRLG